MNEDKNNPLNKECWIKMYSTVTVWAKWQVVIPQEVRELLWIKPWDTLMVVTKFNKAVWMIKMDDVEELMTYMKKEMNT